MKHMDAATLRAQATDLARGVPGLAEELTRAIESFGTGERRLDAEAPAFINALEFTREIPGGGITDERIVVKAQGARPVARIRNNHVTTEFLGPASDTWKRILQETSATIDPKIPSIGRIELNNADVNWYGTGWMIAEGIIVTNRHVAEFFSSYDDATGRFVFKPGRGAGSVSSDIDFLEEENRRDSNEHPITSVLWLAPPSESDVAFLQVTRAENGPPLPEPIELASGITKDSIIVAIGYPARDPSLRDQDLVISIFGDDVYDKKRIAPGVVMGVEGSALTHDCSTLGGNSGSVLLDVKTGKAVGLHQGGYFLSSTVGSEAWNSRDLKSRPH